MSFDLGNYRDVADRMGDLFDKYPDGRLRGSYEVVTIGDRVFIAYTAECYRSEDDTKPAIGVAWEPFPGRTPYTKDSELQNAETSAWGRAILAAGASTTKHGIASRDEVRNRQAEPKRPRFGKAQAKTLLLELVGKDQAAEAWMFGSADDWTDFSEAGVRELAKRWQERPMGDGS